MPNNYTVQIFTVIINIFICNEKISFFHVLHNILLLGSVIGRLCIRAYPEEKERRESFSLIKPLKEVVYMGILNADANIINE